MVYYDSNNNIIKLVEIGIEIKGVVVLLMKWIIIEVVKEKFGIVNKVNDIEEDRIEDISVVEGG